MKRYRHLVILLAALILSAGEVAAQKLTMGFIYPAGGSQGSSVDVEIGGLNLKGATSVLVSGEGVTAKIIPLPLPRPQFTIDENGKKRRVSKNKLSDQSAPQLASRIGVRITIDADASLGLRDLRLQSSNGVSNKLSFEVGEYSNFLESQDAVAGYINKVETLPATLCGYVKPGEVDRFSFKAKAGTMLVTEVKARTLVPYIADAVPGWFQPVVRLVDSKGTEVGFADDYKSSPDPVMRIKIPYDDTFTLSINDAIYRGRQDFNYRIQLGEIPFLESVSQMVVHAKQNSLMMVTGVNLKGEKCVVRPDHEGVNYLRAEGRDGSLSNAVPYYVVGQDTKIITSPTTDTELAEGTVICDYIAEAYAQRKYFVALVADESIVVDALARRIGSRADLRITLLNPEGEVVAENDDTEDSSEGLMTHHADPVVSYKAKASGRYTILVEDVQAHAGRDCGYVLRRMKPTVPFEVFVSPANITIPQGGTATFTLNFQYKSDDRTDFAGVRRIEVDGLPAGYKLSQMTPGRYPRTWEVSVTAPSNAKVSSFPLDVKVYTQAQRDAGEQVVQAKAVDNMTQAFYYVHHIPASAFTAEVVEALPYSVHFDGEVASDLTKPIHINATDTTLALKIRIDRSEGFDDEIELALTNKLKTISMVPVKVSVDESEKVIYLSLNAKQIGKMKALRVPICISATVNGEIQKQGKRTFVNARYRALTPIVIVASKKSAAASKAPRLKLKGAGKRK